MRLLIATAVILMVGGYTYYRLDDQFHSWVETQLGIDGPELLKKPKQPAPVRVATVSQRDVPIVVEGVGNVRAISTVEIKSRIDGQVMEAAVSDGQLVAKGDILFRLDDRPLIAQLRQAEANVSRDQANLDKAKLDATRYKTLSIKGISPQTKLEEAQSSLAVFEAGIKASEAAVELAQLNLDYATIRAPIAGRIGSVLLTPGNMVKANDTQAMLVLTQIRPVNVVFTLPEKYVGELRDRMSTSSGLYVDVSIQGDAEIVERGKLFFVNNVVDMASGTIQAMARFENKDGKLIPGQFARASVTLQVLPQAVIAPAKAIQMNQKGRYAWVVKGDGTVESRALEIGPSIGSDTVIISGLKADETIVTDGQLRLFPGAPVKPVDAESKTSASKGGQS